jgi:hypothetical protein
MKLRLLLLGAVCAHILQILNLGDVPDSDGPYIMQLTTVNDKKVLCYGSFEFSLNKMQKHVDLYSRVMKTKQEVYDTGPIL